MVVVKKEVEANETNNIKINGLEWFCSFTKAQLVNSMDKALRLCHKSYCVENKHPAECCRRNKLEVEATVDVSIAWEIYTLLNDLHWLFAKPKNKAEILSTATSSKNIIESYIRTFMFSKNLQKKHKKLIKVLNEALEAISCLIYVVNNTEV